MRLIGARSLKVIATALSRGAICQLCLVSISSVLVGGFLVGQVAEAQESRVVVGLALPLSGEMARYGLDIQRGAAMAQEELARRGAGISFIAEDTQLLPRMAATAAQKLINRDRVDLILSLWDTAEAVAPIAEQKRTPHVSIRWNHRVAQEFPHTFTFESTYETWVRATLEYLRSRAVRRLAVMTDISAAGWVLGREYLLKVAADYKIEVVRDIEFLGATGDINLSITKLLAEPSDYILMLHFGPSLVDTMRRLSERKVPTPIMGYFDGMEPPINVDRRPFVAQFDSQKWFLDRFSARFPGEKPSRAAFGYDLISILGQLIEHLGRRPTADEILGHFNSLRNYTGATGTISANNSRNIETTCVLKEFRNGEAVVVARP
jgi:ABC-type branched-subunit amino acid transport system substrate-binding protein